MRWAKDWLRAAGIYAAVALGGGLFGGGGNNLGESSAWAQPDDGPPKTDDRQVYYVDRPCSGSFERNGVVHFFAEAEFGGRSARSLARVSVLAHLKSNNTSPPGYDYTVVRDGVSVRDGAAAVSCGSSVDGQRFDSVTFVVPRTYYLDLDPGSPW